VDSSFTLAILAVQGRVPFGGYLATVVVYPHVFIFFGQSGHSVPPSILDFLAPVPV
jgi:hypothetical protein